MSVDAITIHTTNEEESRCLRDTLENLGIGTVSSVWNNGFIFQCVSGYTDHIRRVLRGKAATMEIAEREEPLQYGDKRDELPVNQMRFAEAGVGD